MLTGLLLLGAIAVGSVVGILSPSVAGPAGALTDPLILTLVTLLLTALRGGGRSGLAALRRAPGTVAIAWGFNFVLIPAVAYAVGSLVMIGEDELRVGVLLYCLFPCTDWFLAFTRLAHGDTRIGAALIPLNMATQLLLYPFYLHLLAGTRAGPVGLADWSNLVTWFAVPASVALLLRLGTRAMAGRGAEAYLRDLADRVVPGVLALLVTCLFAANVTTILDHPGPFGRVLVTVFGFLAATYLLGEVITKRARLSYPERALVVMTTSARNAPLILGLTVVALPHRPLVYAAIVLGMLVEFPHLTALQQLLRRSRKRVAAGPRPEDAVAVAS